MIHVEVTDQLLDLAAADLFLSDPSCGGLAYFVGKVRNRNLGYDILHLEFSSYRPMAEREMQHLAKDILANTGAAKLYVAHRIGLLQVGETAVIIGAAAIHRAAAFDACRAMIDQLKERVPIWKKEVSTEGHYWINAHP